MIPTDVIYANPKCSDDSTFCFESVPNSQRKLVNGKHRVLDGSRFATVAIGPAGERANSYTDAYNRCSAICAENKASCKSFNILTTSEPSVNECQPTWVCRYSDRLYDESDYTQHGLPYSQVYNVVDVCDINRGKYPAVPTDTVQANPKKCSSDMKTCYSSVSNDEVKTGDGKYRVLDGAKYPAEAIGLAGDRANSYTDAYNSCSSICAGKKGNCKSFNILTTSEPGVNNCQPTWVCRFSDKPFKQSDLVEASIPYSQVYNVYANCDYGGKVCGDYTSVDVWAKCSVLGENVKFYPKIIRDGMSDYTHFSSGEVDTKIETGCVGAFVWKASVTYK